MIIMCILVVCLSLNMYVANAPGLIITEIYNTPIIKLKSHVSEVL